MMEINNFLGMEEKEFSTHRDNDLQALLEEAALHSFTTRFYILVHVVEPTIEIYYA